MFNFHYLLDCSYLIIFTANSTFKYYTNEFDIPKSYFGPDFDVMADEEFEYLFEQNFIRNINNTCQKVFPILNKSNYVFCQDCPRQEIWRKQIYSNYKQNRDTLPFRFNMKPIFHKVYNFIIPKLIEDYNCCKLSCSYAEGDDIIGILTKHILSKNDNNRILIVSSDKDMVQLYDERKVNILTCDGTERSPKAEIETAIKTQTNKQYTAEDYLLFKICIGDTGDNIPNIKPRLGPKKTIKLIDDKSQLFKLLKEDTSIQDLFKLNSKLISFSNIPNEIKEAVIEKYEQYLETRIDI